MERKVALALLFCLFSSLSAVAESGQAQGKQEDQGQEKQNQRQRSILNSSYARKKINEAVGESVISSPSFPKIDYVPQKEKRRVKKESALSLFLRKNPKVSQANLFVLAKEEGKKENSTTLNTLNSVKSAVSLGKERESRELTGECYFPKDLNISSLPVPVILKCVFGRETGKLYGELVSKGYSLVLLPKKVMVGSSLYLVKSGFALNETTQDLNVATSVNKRILDKILIAGTGAGLEGVKEGVKEYYENKNTTTYTKDQTVVQEKKIDREYPLVYGAISFVSGAFSEFINLFKKEYGEVPVIWKVKAGTTVKVVLEVEAEK